MKTHRLRPRQAVGRALLVSILALTVLLYLTGSSKRAAAQVRPPAVDLRRACVIFSHPRRVLSRRRGRG